MTAPQPEISRQDVIAAQALLSGLTELSSRAGHDLLGPMNQAGTLLALLIKRHRGQVDPEAEKLLEFLQSASDRIEGVTAGVRKYLEIASRPLKFGPVDLNSSLASALVPLKKPIQENGAVIESDSLGMITADAAHMVTIFEALIGNSIKFRKPDTPPGIRVSLGKTGEITIADNGIGIDAEYSEAVFLPFKRLNGRAYAGAGLGLAMAKLICEMHGGNIHIGPGLNCERLPQGTQVHFTLRTIQSK
jgi:light-regulated signal transduction histidine kinase (bacteriophytochrome)